MTTLRDDEIDKAMSEGIVFRGARVESSGADSKKVKTKAKKKAYVTAAHRTGAAKMRQEIRQRRKERNRKHGS